MAEERGGGGISLWGGEGRGSAQEGDIKLTFMSFIGFFNNFQEYLTFENSDNVNSVVFNIPELW